MLSVEQLRADTPGCREVVHLNNAGSALPPSVVVERVIDHLRLEAMIGGYEAADQIAEERASVYDAVAAVIGAGPEEIALTDSATRAWIAAFTAFSFRPGHRILTARAEYSSNIIAMMAAAKRHGVTIQPIPSTETGEVSIEALAAALDDDVRLVAITHAPTNSGLLQPVAEIGRLVRPSPAVFLLDACQSIGQVPIDVTELGVDLLTGTGRKYLRAPRGTGFLYVRRDLIGELEPVHIDLHSASTDGDGYRLRNDARRFELWENAVAATLGLGVALRYYHALGIDAVWDRVRGLGESLRAGLGEVPGARLTDPGTVRSGIVSFCLAGMDPAEIVTRLRGQRIHLVASRRPSTPWDMTDRGLQSVVRASVHYYNDDTDLHTFLAALRALTR
ncbi:MAG TPA: aminotransferase class V-fold PLP-dependent enzyme [Pseudonocardiaceae bacterium]|nr:aminotransferase class V-fold PLP-dependent enzyme [Pseudonocardiaceae bacterium]